MATRVREPGSSNSMIRDGGDLAAGRARGRWQPYPPMWVGHLRMVDIAERGGGGEARE